jgi:LuxR family maltose regulon positive regulatory protein
VLARRDPPLPISSLRAGGKLTEITMKDLRFTLAETQTFMERFLHISIDENTAAILDEKIEGWVTGLRLVAFSVSGKDDLLGAFQALKQDSYPFVQEYLIQEVLSHAPPDFGRYLLETCILDRFCAPLCETLHSLNSTQTIPEDTYGGQAFIDWLEESHLFVIPLDDRHHWFRYHHMFQDLLKGQLESQMGREKILELHSRASEWFTENALIDEAIRHALAAGDSVCAAEILERNRLVEENQDRWHVIGRWLDLLPSEIIQQRPTLLLAQAWQRFNQFRFLEIPPLLERVHSLISDTTVDESVLGELDFHWGYLAIWVHGDGADAVKRLENARSRLSDAQRVLAAETELDLALARYLVGDGKLVTASLENEIETTRSKDVIRLTRLFGAQAFIHLMSGDLPRAAFAVQQMRSSAEEGRNMDVVAWSNYLQALADLQSFRLDEALQGFLLVTERRNIVHQKSAVDALAGLVLTYQAMGRTEDSMGAVKQLLEFVEEMGDPQMVDVAESCRARLALLLGDLESANRWAQSFEAEPQAIGAFFWLEVPLITQTRVQIEMGTRESLERALESLESLRRQGTALHLTCLTIEVRALQSVALERQGRADEAREALEEAVVLAQPGGWIRPFVEPGPPMADLLKQLPEKKVAAAFIQNLLAAIRDEDRRAKYVRETQPALEPAKRPQPLVEPLTNRELDVLELIEQRLQNKEIAEKLFISPETVKGHLRNIYQKLGVSNRRQAVATAKDLGILTRS